MALEGSIKDFSLADIFQLIGIQRKTGVLSLKNKEDDVKVSFLNGLVVNADSPNKRIEEHLGSVLVKTGKLSEANLKRALKLQRETLKKIGVVLVEESMVRPEELREALGLQITQIIYRLFRWKDGQYHFEQDINVDYDKENFTPMSAESLLMEGMRMIDEWPIIERKIPSFDMVFERVSLEGGKQPDLEGADDASGSHEAAKGDDFDQLFGSEQERAPEPAEEASESIKLTREEGFVYQQVNGKATVQEIIERTMLSEFESCRALFDLTNRNLIVPVVKPKKRVDGTKGPSVEVGKYVAKLLKLAVPIVAAVAVAGWGRNPLNILSLPPLHSPPIEALRNESVAVRLRRMAQAIEVFQHLRQTRPGSTEDLVSAGLLHAQDLLDPWGRPFGFERSGEAIVVSARSAAAEDSPVIKQTLLP